MQVLVRDNNVDQALKALKKKMQREGIFREMKLRGHYEKPSEKRAREQAEAIRRARKLARKKLQREGLLPGKPKLLKPGPGGAGGPGGRAADAGGGAGGAGGGFGGGRGRDGRRLWRRRWIWWRRRFRPLSPFDAVYSFDGRACPGHLLFAMRWPRQDTLPRMAAVSASPPSRLFGYDLMRQPQNLPRKRHAAPDQSAASDLCRRSDRPRSDRAGDTLPARELKATIDRYRRRGLPQSAPADRRAARRIQPAVRPGRSRADVQDPGRQEAHRQSGAGRCRQSRRRRQHHEAGQPPHAVSQGRPAVARRHVVSSQPRDLFAPARPRNSARGRRRRHRVRRHARGLRRAAAVDEDR